MRIEILHLQNTDSDLDIRMLMAPTREKAVELLRAGKYQRVGVIETDSVHALVAADCEAASHLETAWTASQNRDEGPWLAAPYTEEPCAAWSRSSMVGDILVAGDMPFLVKASGFECLVPGRDPI